MASRVAVIATGCGFKDGAEITELVSTLISLAQADISYEVFAPSMKVASTNHVTDEVSEQRDIMIEVARITRSAVLPLSQLNSADFDALVMPGGFGVALHLCDFAVKGADCSVDETAHTVISQFHAARKPIVAFCIAPALVAKVLGKHAVTLTIGDDAGTAAEIEKTGAQHLSCAVNDIVIDDKNRIITSPAYMFADALPNQVFAGIQKAIKALVAML